VEALPNQRTVWRCIDRLSWHALPCLVPSGSACEPNSGSIFPSLSTNAHSNRRGRRCYAIKSSQEGGLFFPLARRVPYGVVAAAR
jgi:hypothetical protein